MFNWFKKKESPSEPKVLYFKSTDAAFEYAAEFMQRPLTGGLPLFGQVLAKAGPLVPGLSGQQRWRVRLATEHGVQETQQCGSIADSLIPKANLRSTPIGVGDLVAVDVGSYNPKYPFESPMQYFVILFKLKPEIEVRPGQHVFTPDVEKAQ